MYKFLIFAPATPPQNLVAALLSTPVRCSFEREGANSPNLITLASGTIREGANKGSCGAKRKYVPVVASSSNTSQMLENL